MNVIPNIRRLQKALQVLSLASTLAAFAFAGVLGGCGSSPPPPSPLPEVTEDDVVEALSRLEEWGVTASELSKACKYYIDHSWSYIDAWNSANKVAVDAYPAPAPRRIVDVVVDVGRVADDIAIPDGWAVSVAMSIDESLEDWTEADHVRYEGMIVARKRQLIEPLCTQ